MGYRVLRLTMIYTLWRAASDGPIDPSKGADLPQVYQDEHFEEGGDLGLFKTNPNEAGSNSSLFIQRTSGARQH